MRTRCTHLLREHRRDNVRTPSLFSTRAIAAAGRERGNAAGDESYSAEDGTKTAQRGLKARKSRGDRAMPQ